MFVSEHQVIHCLVTYVDWWQPTTTSVLQVASARRTSDSADGFHPGVLDTLDERSELCRRVARLAEKDRYILFLWYVKQLPVLEIAQAVGISRRQCFRRRSRAIQTILDEDAV